MINDKISNSTNVFTSSTPSAKSTHWFSCCEHGHMGSISFCRFWRTTWEISGLGKWQGSVFGKLGWVCVCGCTPRHSPTMSCCEATTSNISIFRPDAARTSLKVANIYGNVFKQAHKQGYKFIGSRTSFININKRVSLVTGTNRVFCVHWLHPSAICIYLWPFQESEGWWAARACLDQYAPAKIASTPKRQTILKTKK